MSITRTSTRAALALAASLPVIAFASPAQAQMISQSQVGATQVETLPPVPTPSLGQTTTTTTVTTRPLTIAPPTLNGPTFTEEKIIGDDGVETIIRTRRIVRPAPVTPTGQPVQTYPTYPQYPVAPAPVFERDQWLAECERRTSGRSEKEKGGIIGSLLGAIGGGIAGNLIAGTGERLAGTLIGAGTGGLAGLLLGSLIGGGKKGDRYDCESALDGYLSQYGEPGAVRTIPYPYPPAGYGYAYTGQYGYNAGCGCQQPQVALVPIRTQVRQRVIVRERIEETTVPGERIITPRPPRPIKTSPKLIKQ